MFDDKRRIIADPVCPFGEMSSLEYTVDGPCRNRNNEMLAMSLSSDVEGKKEQKKVPHERIELSTLASVDLAPGLNTIINGLHSCKRDNHFTSGAYQVTSYFYRYIHQINSNNHRLHHDQKKGPATLLSD